MKLLYDLFILKIIIELKPKKSSKSDNTQTSIQFHNICNYCCPIFFSKKDLELLIVTAKE